VKAYLESEEKPPWYIDLLNINLNNHERERAVERIGRYFEALSRDGGRITENLDFEKRES
jgi:malate synthase